VDIIFISSNVTCCRYDVDKKNHFGVKQQLLPQTKNYKTGICRRIEE